MTGAEFRAIRDQLRLSAERFEKALGIMGSRGRTVYRWEHGEAIPPLAAILAAAMAEIPEFREWFLRKERR